MQDENGLRQDAENNLNTFRQVMFFLKIIFDSLSAVGNRKVSNTKQNK